VSANQDNVTLAWTHETAINFEIRAQVPQANWIFRDGPMVAVRTNFSKIIPFHHYTNSGAIFDVRGVSTTSTNVTDWSNAMVIPAKSLALDGPPDPADTRNWATTRSTMISANLPGLSLVATNKELVLTWTYSGEITPNHYIRVWRSDDLKSWSLAETLPTTPIGGWNVPQQARGFFIVSSMRDGTNVWDTIKNPVMDP